MSTTLPLSDAKAKFSEIADDVFRTHDRVNVTRNGRECVVIISAEDLESLEATLELLADQPAVDRLAQAEAEFARGDFVTKDEMTELMEARRKSGR